MGRHQGDEMSSDVTLERRVPVIKLLYTFLPKQLLEELRGEKRISGTIESCNDFILCMVATPLIHGDTAHTPQCMSETTDGTKPCIHYVFSLYTHTYDKG